MNSSHENPALPTWLFIATDLALIGAAAVIATFAPHPLSAGYIMLIAACVGAGAIFGLLPLVARYERLKNAQLDERQRELEALARTLHSSAEQISIAARGLHEIAEIAQKNLRAAEQLPHKLQDKIAEFQAQLSGANDADKEELERELLALRTTESERLESVSQRIAKTSAEWTKLEAATQQHLTAANEAIAKLSLGTANAIGKAQAAAEQALALARVEAARTVGEAAGHATRAIDSAKAAALAEFDAKLSAAAGALLERITASAKPIVTPPVSPEPAGSPATPAPPDSSSVPTASREIAPEASESAATAPVQPPRRPRKIRREDAPENSPATAPTAAAVDPHPSEPPSPKPEETTPKAPAAPEEPAPVPAKQIPEITPVAPATAEPFSGHLISNGSASPHPAETPNTPPAPAPAETPRAPKKKARKPEEDEPGLALELDDARAGFASGVSERGLSSDGATRLLVTAYIGIGNRLFIRGQGPGLSWDKGVPLQFVSIGKWRWETSAASAPVEFKLYKNDDLECATLGSQSLDPGHQQEVTASF